MKITLNLIWILVPTLLIVMSAGCALNKPYPNKSYHLPHIESPGRAAIETPTFPHRIKVRNLRVESPFEGKSFVYRLGDDQWTTDFYHEWFTFPRDILTENCVAYLTHKSSFGLISTEDSLVDADYYLEGILNSFHQDRRNAQSMNAVVKTRWVLIPNKPLSNAMEKTLLWSKEFEVHVPCKTDTPQAFAVAMATAMEQTFESLDTELINHFKPPVVK